MLPLFLKEYIDFYTNTIEMAENNIVPTYFYRYEDMILETKVCSPTSANFLLASQR